MWYFFNIFNIVFKNCFITGRLMIWCVLFKNTAFKLVFNFNIIILINCLYSLLNSNFLASFHFYAVNNQIFNGYVNTLLVCCEANSYIPYNPTCIRIWNIVFINVGLTFFYYFTFHFKCICNFVYSLI